MIANALCRKPLVGRESRINDIELSDDITALVDAVQQNWPVTEDRLTEIRVETSTDPIMKSIRYFIDGLVMKVLFHTLFETTTARERYSH